MEAPQPWIGILRPNVGGEIFWSSVKSQNMEEQRLDIEYREWFFW